MMVALVEAHPCRAVGIALAEGRLVMGALDRLGIAVDFAAE